MPKFFMKRINDQFIPIIAKNKTNIMIRCLDQEVSLVNGIKLLELPFNCNIEYKDLKVDILKSEI